MAKSKKKSEESDAKIKATQGNKLFNQIDVQLLRSFVEQHFPKAVQITQKGLSTLLLNCLTPGHPDLHPSMYIDTVRGYATCRACGYYTRNLLQLLEDCKGWTPREALAQLQNHTGLKLVTDKTEKALGELDVHQIATRVVMRVCNEHLAACVRYQLQPASEGHYTAAFIRQVQPTLDWLFKMRGRRADYVGLLPYGLWPPTHMLFERAEKILDELTTSAYAAKDRDHAHWKSVREKVLARTSGTSFSGRIPELVERVDPSWTHAVAFFTGYGFTTPGRIRLRRASPDNVKTNNIILLPGHAEGDPTGYFGLYSKGLSAFHVTPNERDEQVYLLVEGEHDALAVMERLLDAGKTGVVVLASCGSANTTDALAEAGITRVHLWADEPVHGNSEEVIRSRLQTAQRVEVRVFARWHEFAAGDPKDPDDVCRSFPFADVYRIVVAERATSYKPTEVWALDRAVEVVAERAIPEDEIRARSAVAVEYGACVRHPAQLAEYVERVAKALGLSPSTLRSAIVNAQDTEAEFISRISQTLHHEFHTLYKIDNARGGELHLFHKRQRRPIQFFMTDGRAMMAQLSNVFGEMYGYFKDHIGLPGVADDKAEDLRGTTPIKDGHKNIREYLEIAMQDIYKGVLSQSECTELGQGIHYVVDPEDDADRCLYVNNGNRTYRGRYVANRLNWVELAGPSDGCYLFKTAPRAWSNEVRGVADLEATNAFTLEDVRRARDDLYQVFFNHWVFETPRVDATFLANHLLALSVHAAFPTKGILSFIGPTHTGKSTLLSVFCGKNSRSLQVLEASEAISDYTPAAIYQSWDHSAILMALDEFEDEGDNSAKATAVTNISTQLRDIIGESGARIKRGSSDGSAKCYEVHVPVITSSITRAKKGQDENRRFIIATKHKEGMKDPSIAIYETVTPARLSEIRRVCTLGLLRHVPELLRHYTEIRHRLNTSQVVPSTVPMRFLNNFLPLGAVMALLGEDWQAYLVDASASRAESLAAAAHDTISNNIHEQILRSPTVKISAVATGSVLQLLGAGGDDWRQINAAQCGVYWDESRHQLTVDWIAITSPNGLLGRVNELNHRGWRDLKHQLDQHDEAIKTSDYVRHGVAAFLQSVNIEMVPHELTVLRMRDRVAALRSGPKAVGTGPDPIQVARHAPEAAAEPPVGSDNNV